MTNNGNKSKEREELNKLLEEYRAKGGEIRKMKTSRSEKWRLREELSSSPGAKSNVEEKRIVGRIDAKRKRRS